MQSTISLLEMNALLGVFLTLCHTIVSHEYVVTIESFVFNSGSIFSCVWSDRDVLGNVEVMQLDFEMENFTSLSVTRRINWNIDYKGQNPPPDSEKVVTELTVVQRDIQAIIPLAMVRRAKWMLIWLSDESKLFNIVDFYYLNSTDQLRSLKPPGLIVFFVCFNWNFMHEYIRSHKHCSLGDNYSLPIVYMHCSNVQGVIVCLHWNWKNFQDAETCLHRMQG